MDDVGKAIVMVAQVLMFVLAASVSIYLYSNLTNSAEQIFIGDEGSNRGDAIIGTEDLGTTRKVNPEEILMAILDLKSEYENNDVTAEVKIKNFAEIISYTYDGVNEKIVRVQGVMDSPYDFNSMGLRDILYSDLGLSTGSSRTYSLQNKGNTLLYVKN